MSFQTPDSTTGQSLRAIFDFDPPLSTKREKNSHRSTPARPQIPPPQPTRLIRTDPTFTSRTSYIEPFARVVSFKSPSERPSLSNRYRFDEDDTYLHQCFEIQRRLGQGSFGEVISAKSKDDGKCYAVKCAINIYRGNNDRKAKLEEVRKHEMLPPHPNLVKFVKAWEEKGRLYIQTELCSKSLDQIAREKHEIPEPEIWYYLIDMLMALEHLHSHDLLHVDIKPENIFVTTDGICKLGDFGLVLDLHRDDLTDPLEGDSKYLAAEVLNDRPTKAADIFSLGMTILELATDLELPNNGIHWHEIRSLILDEKYTKFLSSDLKNVIARMIDPDSKKRPKASELLEDPIVCRYKFQRKMLVARHCLSADICDRLFSIFFFLITPFICFFHVIMRCIRSKKIGTPKDNRTQRPSYYMDCDSPHSRVSFTPVFDDSDDEIGNRRRLLGHISSARQRISFSDSPLSKRTKLNKRRIPILDLDQPISSKFKPSPSDDPETSEEFDED